MAGIQIPIEVIDKFSKNLDTLNTKMSSLSDSAKKQNTSFNILAADVVFRYGKQAADAIFKFGEDCLKSFADSEKAVSRFDTAIRNQGITNAGYSLRLQALAGDIQKVTTSSDEAVLETMTLLTTFGLAGKELEQVTKATIDLSSGLGIDLRSATMLMGKAFVGETGSLGRFGIKISDTVKEGDKFAAVMGQVNSRFGGAAAAEATTYAGKIAVLANSFDDMKEKIGKNLMPVALRFTEWMNGAVGTIDAYLARHEGLGKSKDAASMSTRRLISELQEEKKTLEGSDPAHVTKQMRLKEVNAQLAIEIEFYKTRASVLKSQPKDADPISKKNNDEADAAAAKAAKVLAIEKKQLDASALQKFNAHTMTSQQLQVLQDQEDVAFIQKQLGTDAAKEAQTAITENRMKVIKVNAAQAGMAAMSALATLQGAKNKQMAAVGKAAASAMTLISTYQAAIQAMAALSKIPIVGPALGFAAAAAITVAGMANVAMINGVPLAEGGLVSARSGGTNAVIGEGGRDEAVIPLDDPRTQRRLAGAFGGGRGTVVNVGGINITITGAVENARGIAKQLAEEIRTETVDAIHLALRLSNLSNQNQGLAA